MLRWVAPSFRAAAGFQLPRDLVLQTLPSTRLSAELSRPHQHNPAFKSELQHPYAHLKCPRYVNAVMVFVKCRKLPQKERIHRHNYLGDLFLAHVTSGQL